MLFLLIDVFVIYRLQTVPVICRALNFPDKSWEVLALHHEVLFPFKFGITVFKKKEKLDHWSFHIRIILFLSFF